MPELPEVETNATNFRRWTAGKHFKKVTPPPGQRELGGMAPKTFARQVLAGEGVAEVTRRGKWILCRLTSGAGLGLHLGMTGKIARIKSSEPLLRFTRASFVLDDGHTVCFVDSRRFGRLNVTKTYEALAGRKDIKAIGPDALELTLAELQGVLEKSSRAIKEVIMDQARIGGIGNLYATEALWHAKIHPAEPARNVAERKDDVKKLLAGIKKALKHGLGEYEGSELPEYLEDGAENTFFAYDRKGVQCPRCHMGVFEVMQLGGRTSAFCPVCQKLK